MPERNRRKYGLAATEIDPRHRSSKDTKRWCGGKIGLEHDSEWQDVDTAKFGDRLAWRENLVCKKCRKYLDMRYKKWTFGSAIAAIREQKGLRQEDLASRVGTSQENICRIESDKNPPTLTTVQKIMEALDLSCDLHIHNCADVVVYRVPRP